MKIKYWWILARSYFSSRDEVLDALARKSLEMGRKMAGDTINSQREFLRERCDSDCVLRNHIEMRGEILQISIELQFLWGFFAEHVKKYSLPAGEYERIQAHLIDWLTSYRGYKIDESVGEIREIARIYNMCDPIFEEISQAGGADYNDHDPSFLYRINCLLCARHL